MFTRKTKQGFTYIELTIVLVIIGILMTYAIGNIRRSQINADITAQVENIAYQLRLAQSNAASGKGNTSYGANLETNAVTLYQGSTYDPMSATNYRIELPSSIQIQNINLNGGGNKILFAISTGATANYGSFNVTASSVSITKTITVTRLGTVNY
jgi:prepilin-type N-terminal cleavage/methylation domain-containing protein